MVAARIHRHAVEVLVQGQTTAALERQEIEVAVEDSESGLGSSARIHRHAVEALFASVPAAALERQELEVAVEDSESGLGSSARVHRHAVEVLFAAPPTAALERQEIEAAVADAGTASGVRIHRHAIEILARAGIPDVVPLSYPTGLDYFAFNWVNGLRMETRYETDVTRSPTTLAEERRGLLQRPQRTVDANWLHEGRAEIDRLFVTLRRLTNDNLVLPLYQDTVVVGQSPTGASKLFGTFQYRRYFDGGRVVVFPVTPLAPVSLAANVDIYSIVNVRTGHLVVDRQLDRTYDAGDWHIAPLIDLELLLEPSVRQHTDDTSEVSLTLSEVVGPNALPPSFVGRSPDGWRVELGNPVLEIDPDWEGGLQTTYMRYGQRRKEGRKPVVVPQGPRYVQVQEFKLKMERPDFWRILNLFDSRRGRLGVFWEIDREEIWTVTDTDPQFVDVSPFGQFSDFSSGFTSHCGIVMKDGTTYIREVNTIQDVLGSWRLTLVAGNDLPDPLDVTQIERFSRARLKRFSSDSLTEDWHTTELVEMQFGTVEVLEEKEVDIG